MNIRHLLAASATSAMLVTGLNVPLAHADSPPNPDKAGSAVTWGDDRPASEGGVAPAMAVPNSLTSPVVDVAASPNATGLVTADGKLTVLGESTNSFVNSAPEMTDAVAVATGLGNLGAALREDGSVVAWGRPGFDEVPADLRAKAIATSPIGIGLAVRTDGQLISWNDSPEEPMYPIPATGMDDVVDVVVGQMQALALHEDGTVTSVAPSFVDPSFSEVPDFGGKKAVAVAAGANANGVILDDGSIRLWGPNVPEGIEIPAGKKVVSLSAGSYNVGAVTDDGDVHVWGPRADIAAVPENLEGQPVSSIVVADKHAAAIITDFHELNAPVVTGKAVVGQTLHASPATYSLTPESTTGAWLANGKTVTGQTGNKLKLTPALVGKKISFSSTATRGEETLSSTSPATAAVAKAAATVRGKALVAGKRAKKFAKKVTIILTVRTAKGVSPAGRTVVQLQGKTKRRAIVKVSPSGKARAIFPRIKHGRYVAKLTYTGNAGVKKATWAVRFRA